MPSPLKRPIPGRLGRFLASLRPPARKGPLPVQTGFPTSLADLVVKNHVRLRKPKKRRPTTVASSPPLPVAAAATASVEPPSQPRPELSLVQETVQAPKGAAFTLRPELLALGGVVALALLAIWSRGLVAAFTALSLSLLWTESVRSASRRRPTEANELLDLCGRGPVSPIREVESETETPRSSSADSDKGSEAPSIWSADRSELGAAVDPINPERKQKRSLRKLIAKKLHKIKKPKEKAEDSSAACDVEGKESDAGGDAEPAEIEALVASTEPRPSESSREEEEVGYGRGRAFPFAAFIPVVLVVLVAGKLPAMALTVLCVVLSCSVDRLPAS